MRCLMPGTAAFRLQGRARPLRLGLLAALLHSALVSAQQAAETPLNLQTSPLLQEQITPEVRSSLPSFVSGQRITGRPDQETVVEGNAMLRRGDLVIKADRLDYTQVTDVARAQGHVLINRAGNIYEGPLLELRLETFEGFFNTPSYHFLNNDAHGQADRIDFLDEQRAVIHNATFTTCRRLPGPSWMPDWILKASTISLNNEEDVGTATGALLSFKGLPLLPVPYISFPLSEKRKSGVLPPTIGLDTVNGTEISVPYYWNIAPNRDATLTPTVMSKRGVNLGTEFRYLEASYTGNLNLDWMPSDLLRDADRWGLNLNHQARTASAWTDDGASLNLSLNRVSDDNYWRDFSSSEALLTQRLLPGDALASWASGPVSGTVHVLKWQVLQDPDSPIVPPYDRVPQITAHMGQGNVQGFDWSLDGDFTQFEADRTRTGQPNTQRTFALAQLSRPWLAPQGFITPKLQLHAAAYQFDAMLADGNQSASSVVPTFSLDSGLVFERNSALWGRDYVQTLEPRAFYVYTPYRNQSLLPNYDTGAADFNFASIYLENAFVGHDKISDNNLLTMGLTTRFLDPDSGNQYARFGVAQRLRFEPQQVTINSATSPAESGLSDVLLGAEVNLNERWTVDSTTQYNPLTDQSVRATVGARYNPGNYRVLNAAYRFQRNVSEQIDVSWQWPINDLWGDRGQELGKGRGQGDGRYYALGRLNYSLDQSALVDTILGVEYDAGCWLARVVLARTQTSTSSAVQRLIFQLEFVGFTRIGTADPRATLTQNISRYQNLRDAGGASVSRFSNYE